MNNCGVFVAGFLVVSLLALSNGAPQNGNAGGAGEGQLGGSASFGFGMGASAGGSGSAGGTAGGSSSGGSPGSSSLVKRDLANHAPIAHHIHSASCFGQGGGQGPPPPPPPQNATNTG